MAMWARINGDPKHETMDLTLPNLYYYHKYAQQYFF